MIDDSMLFQHSRMRPLRHQLSGFLKTCANVGVMNADDPGLGKSKQTIDALCALWLERKISRAIIVCPAPIRSVWADPEFGQLVQHMWEAVPYAVTEYKTGKIREWRRGEGTRVLSIIVTNYEFIRAEARLEPLLNLGAETALVLDESSAVSGWNSQQTKACERLRAVCDRAILLNGTPVGHSPATLYPQGRLIKPDIWGKKEGLRHGWFRFRSTYAKMGGFKNKQIVAWKNLDQLQAIMAPYVIRRTADDVLDLPDRIEPTVITVPLDPKTWAVYKDMRDELVAYLSAGSASVASHAATKALRLSQITSGFVGGIVETKPCPECGALPQFYCDQCGGSGILEEKADARPLSTEKQDLVLDWISGIFEREENAKIVVWCRFVPELLRLARAAEARFPSAQVAELRGYGPGHTKVDRSKALRLLDRVSTCAGPAIIAGTPATGSMGIDGTAAHHAIYQSNDYKSLIRVQSEARLRRQGQVFGCRYYDIVATGPEGQRTIDHAVLKALRQRIDLADMTTGAWLEELRKE